MPPAPLTAALARAVEPAEATAIVRRPARVRLLGLLMLLALTALAVALSLAVGSKSLELSQVWQALVDPAGREADIIVRELRAPRTVLALAAGAALGLAGALMQGHTRNPLADPGVLGVNAGAAVAVVLAIYLLGVTSPLGYVWFALAGALTASVAVFVLGSAGRGAGTPVTLALAGAAVTAFLTSLTSAVILLDQETLDAFRFWRVGSVAGRDADLLTSLGPFLLAGAVLAAVNAPALNTLALGEDLARGLGLHVARTRIVGVAAVTLLTGSAVSLCGPIMFVGLVVPHVARAITGPDHRWLFPYSALTGALLMTLGDVVGRVVVRPGELQVGIVVALVGAPFFVFLVRRSKLVTL
jgi:iron complex transport system permease protein